MPIFAGAILHGDAHTLGFLMEAGLGALMLWLSLLAVATAGFGMMRHMASSNTVLQTIVAEDKHGRVMAYYPMAFQGIAPFGSLGAGAIAAKLGTPWTIMAQPRGAPHLRGIGHLAAGTALAGAVIAPSGIATDNRR